jgi:hypothetical protein
VQGANPEKPYVMALDYGGSMEQLEALIDGSEHCEQEVAYHCRRSRLLNTPGKAHFASALPQGNVGGWPQWHRWIPCTLNIKKGDAVVAVHCAVETDMARRTGYV